MFYNISTSRYCNKTFYGRNVFVTGKSFQPSESWLTPLGFGLKYIDYTRLERLARDKHSSLIQKSVNYYRKNLITLGVS
jgi:hypothetical protein